MFSIQLVYEEETNNEMMKIQKQTVKEIKQKTNEKKKKKNIKCEIRKEAK